VLLDSVRLSGAVTTPDGVDIRDEEFAPRNREYAIRGNSPEAPDLLAWAPASQSNRRLDYLTKVFSRRGIDRDPREVLVEMWGYLTAPESDWARPRGRVRSPGAVVAHRVRTVRVRAGRE